ncbi:hypothetical protein BDW42DRAFT_158730 [Aspergillus taichungensis]|uniref:Uncharacterized protein n=1 Tax=Aspergillus taichungensis TaxID=482145 RepID=A0A2J5I919_9EURO|nr:hypothetical protein BDW42DRAFT_158730 [Aspergillus taichungensis]
MDYLNTWRGSQKLPRLEETFKSKQDGKSANGPADCSQSTRASSLPNRFTMSPVYLNLDASCRDCSVVSYNSSIQADYTATC